MMTGSTRTLGVFLLVVIALAAGSAVCLALANVNAMVDCGGQMNGNGVCPFMSIGLPAIAVSSLGKDKAVFAILIAALITTAFAIRESIRARMAHSGYLHSPQLPPKVFLNSVLGLISRGILHSRVFSF